MPNLTAGFRSAALLRQHHLKHHQEFWGLTEAEYERQADMFLGGPRDQDTQECIRSNGDTLRYNTRTDELGVLASDGFIRTYMRANPARHSQPTNLDYFLAECAQ